MLVINNEYNQQSKEKSLLDFLLFKPQVFISCHCRPPTILLVSRAQNFLALTASVDIPDLKKRFQFNFWLINKLSWKSSRLVFKTVSLSVKNPKLLS